MNLLLVFILGIFLGGLIVCFRLGIIFYQVKKIQLEVEYQLESLKKMREIALKVEELKKNES